MEWGTRQVSEGESLQRDRKLQLDCSSNRRTMNEESGISPIIIIIIIMFVMVEIERSRFDERRQMSDVSAATARCQMRA
jgi:hypothetical protein